MKRIIAFLFFLPIVGLAQKDTVGITFVQDSWEVVKLKAKSTNKFIFVDCYATWCGPCKDMDKNVYPLKEVGDFFNRNFISVKYQMDTTLKDNDSIVSKYADAHSIMDTYGVYSYPTFLFFSPSGQLVHRAAGGYNEAGFIKLAKDAIDPRRQYYTQVSEFKEGKRDTASMRALADLAISIGDYDFAKQVAREYVKLIPERDLLNKEKIFFILNVAQDKSFAEKLAKKYIDSLNERDLLIKDNLQFVRHFTNHSGDTWFNFFLKNSRKINSILGEPDIAERHVVYIISNELVTPVFKRATGTPEWSTMRLNVQKKYGRYYADRVITNAKTIWYGSKLNWPEYCKNLVLYVEKYGKNKSVWDLNNDAWSIFQRSENTNELRKALAWSERCIKLDPTYVNAIDTYANILYKLKRVQEAIVWEKKAISLSAEPEYLRVLEKMQKGVPTWPMN